MKLELAQVRGEGKTMSNRNVILSQQIDEMREASQKTNGQLKDKTFNLTMENKGLLEQNKSLQ